MFRLAEGANSASKHDDLTRLIEKDGCRIGDPATQALLPSLTLAATLPDDDFEAFQVATALLLADRLQAGGGTDDMFWHWDAFQEHYLTAQPQVRAAILQGYAHANDLRLVSLVDPPEISTRTTDTKPAIEEYLASACEGPLARYADGIAMALWGDQVLDETWTIYCLPLLEARTTPETLLRCLRYLYESRPDFAIHPGETFDPSADDPLLIPYLPRPMDLP
jgi:hypothetical protein